MLFGIRECQSCCDTDREVQNTGNGASEQIDSVVVRTGVPTEQRIRLYVVYVIWQLSITSFATCVCGVAETVDDVLIGHQRLRE